MRAVSVLALEGCCEGRGLLAATAGAGLLVTGTCEGRRVLLGLEEGSGGLFVFMRGPRMKVAGVVLAEDEAA